VNAMPMHVVAPRISCSRGPAQNLAAMSRPRSRLRGGILVTASGDFTVRSGRRRRRPRLRCGHGLSSSAISTANWKGPIRRQATPSITAKQFERDQLAAKSFPLMASTMTAAFSIRSSAIPSAVQAYRRPRFPSFAFQGASIAPRRSVAVRWRNRPARDDQRFVTSGRCVPCSVRGIFSPWTRDGCGCVRVSPVRDLQAILPVKIDRGDSAIGRFTTASLDVKSRSAPSRAARACRQKAALRSGATIDVAHLGLLAVTRHQTSCVICVAELDVEHPGSG